LAKTFEKNLVLVMPTARLLYWCAKLTVRLKVKENLFNEY